MSEIGARRSVVDVGGPRVADRLTQGIGLVGDLRGRERREHHLRELGGRRIEGTDVVGRLRQRRGVGGHEPKDAVDGVRHRHERDARVFRDEALVRLALSRRVQHFGAEVRRAARGQRVGGDEPREANAAEIDGLRGGVARHVAAEMLAVELVAAVHGGRLLPLMFLDAREFVLRLPIGKSVHRDRRREQHLDALALGRGLLVGQIEHVERAADVHLVGERGAAFGTRGKQRREVEDLADFVGVRDFADRVRAGDVARVLTMDERRRVRGERFQVERDDRVGRGCEARDQRVTDLAAGAGHEGDGLPRHAWMLAT